MGRRHGSRGCIGCDKHKSTSSQIQGVKIVSLQVSEDRQWRVQLPLNANQSTGSGDNSVEKPCPLEAKSGGCQLLFVYAYNLGKP
jgi:hypothetical protein